CVRGEIRVAGAAGEDSDTLFLKMADGATADERLSDLVHLNRGLHAGVDALLFECILEGEGIDDGGKHAHMIGGDAIHIAGLFSDAAKESAASEPDCNCDGKR